MKRIALSLAFLLLLTAALAACSPANGPQGGAIELTDASGRTVTLQKTPEKIVALFPSDVEMLYALGAQERIVAVGEYCNYPPEAMEKTIVGTGENTSLEQLIALQPDLVTMGTMAQQIDQVEALEAAGIAVLITETTANSIDGAYVTIQMLGKAVGKSAEAAALVAQMKERFDAIAKKAAALEQKSVYVEISPLIYGLYTSGSDTFIAEILEIAGARNAFEDLSGWQGISQEQVVARNPDVILTTTDESYGVGDPVDEITSRPGWDVIAAVKEGDVYTINSDASTRPGPRLVEAAEEIFGIVHGEK